MILIRAAAVQVLIFEKIAQVVVIARARKEVMTIAQSAWNGYPMLSFCRAGTRIFAINVSKIGKRKATSTARHAEKKSQKLLKFINNFSGVKKSFLKHDINK